MMRRIWILTLALGVVACGDPETEDERGYTKAPLENPGLLVAGEAASPMAELGRPDLPRTEEELWVEEQETGGPAGGEAAGGGQVALAEGVTQEQFDQGQALFTGQGGCQACHGPDGGGSQLGPNLTDSEWFHVPGPEVEAIAGVIRNGVSQPVQYPAPMPPMGGADLNDEQIQALAGYVASIAQS